MMLARTPAERRRPDPPAQSGPPADWIERATAMMAAFVKALWAGNTPGSDYLMGRGLDPGTWEAFRLGYATNAMNAGPAIALPWYRGGALWGIRYRLLNPPPGRDKIISERGSRYGGILFGGQALALPPDSDLLSCRTLCIVEGEINAMSVWQVAQDARVDVLSLGSEAAHLTDAAIAVAKRYRACLVWMDKADKAREYAAKVSGGASWSEVKGKKSDANDLLRDGKLGGVIANLLRRITPAQYTEALKYDLWDAANQLGADEGLRKAVMG